MKYIVFDMEWNQAMGPCRTLFDGRMLTGEIIEIGAVKLSDNFEIEDAFKTFVKPVFYRKLHKKVKELTGLNSEILNDGVPFPEAYAAFRAFCGSDFATVTWGESDVPILKENILAHKLGKWTAPNYNLQKIYDGDIARTSKNTALDEAAAALGVSSGVPYHDAMNDASATAGICRAIDMKNAVANYKFSSPALSSLDHLFFETVNGIPDVHSMKTHPRIKYTLCPDCRRPLPAERIIPYGSNRRLARITCPEHGDFLLLIRISKDKKGENRALKYVYEWTEDTETLYKSRLETANRKKEIFLEKIREKKIKEKANKN